MEVKSEIARLEERIKDFQTKCGVLDVETLAKEKITMLAEVRSRLTMKEMEIKTYSDFSTIQDPVILRLKAERDNLAKLLKEMESGFSEYERVMSSQEDLSQLAFQFARM